MFNLRLFLAGAAILANSPLNAQGLSVCSSIPVIFTSETMTRTEGITENFKKLQCASTWKSAQDAISAGVGVDVPIFDLPVSFTGSWDQEKVEKWKSNNCTNEERSANYTTTLYRSSYSVDPVSAKAQLDCIKSFIEQKAVSCGVTETGSAIVFEVFWRRTPGESSNPPVVSSFDTVNTNCSGKGVLASGVAIGEGGVSVLCSLEDQSPAFSINTNRGNCIASASGKEKVLTLDGEVELSGPVSYRASRIYISDGFKLTTNGYPLRLQADTLELGGSASIISFMTPKADIMKSGKTAGPINVSAKRIMGDGSVSILNAGQNGGDGDVGPTGSPGAPGSPGVGRTAQWNELCPVPFLCKYVPTGCEGGANGGRGGTGGIGYPGIQGMPGGGAGDVKVSDKERFVVFLDTSIDGTPRNCDGSICGGLGGTGGPGGAGGSGGPGGPGASGTTYCGGTDMGGRGDQGPQGPQGESGAEGPNAEYEVF